MGSSQRAKQIRRKVRQARNEIILSFLEEVRAWSLWDRIKLAWLIVRVKQKR